MSVPPYGGIPTSVPTFGHGFNYMLWEPGTIVELCNVPWNSDYRDLVYGDQAIADYIDAQTSKFVYTQMSYAPLNRPLRIDMPFNHAVDYNYVRVTNPAQPITWDNGTRNDVYNRAYYFIRDVVYHAPNTTELVLQLDVWATFQSQFDFGNCYIERGHVGVANEHRMRDFGREFLTVPEGLDLGGEYSITAMYEHILADNSENGYDILVWATTNILPGPYAWGTETAPQLETAVPCPAENVPNGATCAWFPYRDDFRTFMQQVSLAPWISQGIICIMIVPSLHRLPEESWFGTTISGDGWEYEVRTFGFDAELPPLNVELAVDWRDHIMDELPSELRSRYSHLDKFKVYPYSAVELTTYTGTPLVLKPECMNETDMTVNIRQTFSLPSPRLVITPNRYNAIDGGSHGEFLDMATTISNFPTYSVVNDSYRAFIASNKNSVTYQHQSADWSQQRALTANALSFDQASSGIDMQNNLAAIQQRTNDASLGVSNRATLDTANVNAITGVVGGALGGVAGGPAGIGLGLLGGAVQAGGTLVNANIATNAASHQNAITNNNIHDTTNVRTGQSGYIRDTNKAYADFAARGDYANAIAGINAKVQDAKLLQPTTSGQLGGDAFNLIAWRWAIHAKVKIVSSQALVAIGEFWLRYGYMVNRFHKPDNLLPMTHFAYWKMRETYFDFAFIPEGYKQTIRGIFEKGVTVWRNPGDIGRIDLGINQPLEGVVL